MVSYNTSTNKVYTDFLGRIDAQNLALRSSLSNKIFDSDLMLASDSSITVIVVSLIGLTATAGYFLIKRRKEQR